LTPVGVPTTTAVSPAWKPKSGVGAGKAVWARSTATMDTPVRLRTWVSAIVPPAYGERSWTVSQEIGGRGQAALAHDAAGQARTGGVVKRPLMPFNSPGLGRPHRDLPQEQVG
jgi:hypothetical protein